ncbi:metal-dependent hydrolase [Thermococcus sp. GR6]|uniref:metal-dependent hydrolase n=1 Tax=Thermococcus sp. GR6 TaxID=1638256 RepID=UPI0014309E1A|nr:metal-dependent hydrolase [Thermococcus sp. GR6]NJE43138.1 metal-dependent hydrolase [Thermococcus sp. GR6]
MNYEEHVLAGIITYPLAIAVASLLKNFGLPIELSTMAMVLGYALYVLGSDLPDMDHPNALIHRGTKPLVSVAVGSVVYLRSVDIVNIGTEWENITLAWVIGAIAGVIAWYGFTAIMPKHRGIIHSLLFAFVYGLIAFALGNFGVGLPFEESVFLGFAAFSGYTLHLVLDRDVSMV